MIEQDQVASDIEVQCVRCRNRHQQSERVRLGGNDGMSMLACPRCSCRSFLDIRPQAAWCWASGLIEIGDESASPADAILFARGPKAFLTGTIAVLARSGQGASEGKYLVPGVPEADDQEAGCTALIKWVKWCAGNNGHKGRHGVVFVAPSE
jgi:predicted nucleic-acid-binding Zn-ribbon protein